MGEHQSRARIPRESTIERGTAPKRLHYILRTTTPLRNRTSTPPMNKGPVFLTITTTGCLIYTYGERLWMRIISKNVVTLLRGLADWRRHGSTAVLQSLASRR